MYKPTHILAAKLTQSLLHCSDRLPTLAKRAKPLLSSSFRASVTPQDSFRERISMSSVAAMTKLTLKIGGQGGRFWHFFLSCAGPVLLLHLSLCPGSAVAAADEPRKAALYNVSQFGPKVLAQTNAVSVQFMELGGGRGRSPSCLLGASIIPGQAYKSWVSTLVSSTSGARPPAF